MATNPNEWVYGNGAPDPNQHDLLGLKANWIVKRLPSTNGLRVLDYGCGEGKHLALVAAHSPGATLVGVDIREPHRAPSHFQFFQLDHQGTLDFEDESFDVVVSCDVLEHVASIEHSLDEVRRVLRVGGSFIGFVPLEGGFCPHAFFRAFDPNLYRDTKDHVRSLTKREMTDLLGERFKIVRCEYSYHLFGALMDATFFASFKLPGVGAKIEAFWRGAENPCYRIVGDRSPPSVMGRLTRLANTISYYESKALRNVSAVGFGLHFHVRRTAAISG